MYAGSSGSSHGCNKNSPGNGNGKWQGLAPITNMRSSLIPYTRARAGGENRDYVFCVNQLAGGVGKRSGQFVPGAGGGVKDCTPTHRIDPAVLESVAILQSFAATQGLILALRGVEESINTDIDELHNTSFHNFDAYLVSEGHDDVRKAIKIINELKIKLGVLSSADVQIHEVTMVSQLDAIALADKGFGIDMSDFLGSSVIAYGTSYLERLPILALFAGGFANKCSNVPKVFRTDPYGDYSGSGTGAINDSQFGALRILENDMVGVGIASNLTSLATSLETFYDNWPMQAKGTGPFPWVNKNAKLGEASSAAMNMYRNFTNTDMTLTIAGTSIPLPAADSTTLVSPIGWESDVADTTISDYRKIFDPSDSTIMSGVLGYGYNKSSPTFKNRVLGSSDDLTPDGVIVPRVFDYASGYTGDLAFQNLSNLGNTNSPLIFNVLLGYEISKNDNGLWVTEKEIYNSSPIGTLNC